MTADSFASHGVESMHVKSAYTSIAASAIAMILEISNGSKQSADTTKLLEQYWQDEHYLTIDEVSMVPLEFVA